MLSNCLFLLFFPSIYFYVFVWLLLGVFIGQSTLVLGSNQCRPPICQFWLVVGRSFWEGYNRRLVNFWKELRQSRWEEEMLVCGGIGLWWRVRILIEEKKNTRERIGEREKENVREKNVGPWAAVAVLVGGTLAKKAWNKRKYIRV